MRLDMYRGIRANEATDSPEEILRKEMNNKNRFRIFRPLVHHHDMTPTQVSDIVMSEPEKVKRFNPFSHQDADFGLAASGQFFGASAYASMKSEQKEFAKVIEFQVDVKSLFINANDFLYPFMMNCVYNHFTLSKSDQEIIEMMFGRKILNYIYNLRKLNSSSHNRIFRYVDFITHDVDVIFDHAYNYTILIENIHNMYTFSSFGIIGGITELHEPKVTEANFYKSSSILDELKNDTECELIFSLSNF